VPTKFLRLSKMVVKSKFFAKQSSPHSSPHSSQDVSALPGASSSRVLSKFFLAKQSPPVTGSGSPSALGSSTCPQCHGTLVDRIGRWGVFTGCTGFPKCRFTRKPSRRKPHLTITVEMETPDTVRVYSLAEEQPQNDFMREMLATTDLIPVHTEPRHDQAGGNIWCVSPVRMRHFASLLSLSRRNRWFECRHIDLCGL
jgi:hypothetical protein